MKTEKNIRIAFLLNLCFSVFELIGGIYTGSIAILSDALHDAGDAVSIGVSCVLERKSKKAPDEEYSYGYVRYSVLGGIFSTVVLLLGSVMVIFRAIKRMINPMPIHYDGMILLAVIGVIVNFTAAFLTRGGESLHQKAVNLHMLEDVLGWGIVLAGAVLMRFTDFMLLDPLLSVGVATFILINAWRHLMEARDLFLERIPRGVDVSAIKKEILQNADVCDVHHIHIRSIDGISHVATMHIVLRGDGQKAKAHVRAVLKEHGIMHVTIETEEENAVCMDATCHIEVKETHHHHAH